MTVTSCWLRKLKNGLQNKCSSKSSTCFHFQFNVLIYKMKKWVFFLKYRAIYTAISSFSCSVLKISLSYEWSSGFFREVLHPVFLYPVEKEYCCHIFLIGFYFFYLIGQNTRKDKVETCSGRCHCIRSSSDGREKMSFPSLYNSLLCCLGRTIVTVKQKVEFVRAVTSWQTLLLLSSPRIKYNFCCYKFFFSRWH